jgi:hypothetical protein
MKILILISFLCFAGCAGVQIDPHETDIMSLRLDPVTGKSRCRKTPFIFSQEKVGSVSPGVNVPLDECAELTGLKTFSQDGRDFSELRAWVEEIFDAVEDSNTFENTPVLDLEVR